MFAEWYFPNLFIVVYPRYLLKTYYTIDKSQNCIGNFLPYIGFLIYKNLYL